VRLESGVADVEFSRGLARSKQSGALHEDSLEGSTTVLFMVAQGECANRGISRIKTFHSL
jgi:hypothetical protein